MTDIEKIASRGIEVRFMEPRYRIDDELFTMEEAKKRFSLEFLVDNGIITDPIEIARIRLDQRNV